MQIKGGLDRLFSREKESKESSLTRETFELRLNQVFRIFFFFGNETYANK